MKWIIKAAPMPHRKSVPFLRSGSTGPNDNGIVLVVGLLFIAVLAAVGSIAYMTATNDLSITSNYRAVNEAFNASQAGVEEVRERLRIAKIDPEYAGDPSAGYDPWWSAYVMTAGNWTIDDDPSYHPSYANYFPLSNNPVNTVPTVNSLNTTGAEYLIKIRHKREYDAEKLGHSSYDPHYIDGDGSTASNSWGSPGSILYYGYGDPSNVAKMVQYTTSGSADYKPVELITAIGGSGLGRFALEVEAAAFPGPPIMAAIYAKGDVTGNGTSLAVDGNDNCGSAAPKPPVYTLDPAVTGLNGTPTMLGDPPGPQSGPADVDIQNYIDILKDSPDLILTEDINGGAFGDANNYLTVYSNPSNPYNVSGLKLSNVTGYGTLLVEGDCTFGGGFDWYGLVLVSGTLVFNGGGPNSINIRGAVLAENTVDINGGINITYDSCDVAEAISTAKVSIINWRDLTLVKKR